MLNNVIFFFLFPSRPARERLGRTRSDHCDRTGSRPAKSSSNWAKPTKPGSRSPFPCLTPLPVPGTVYSTGYADTWWYVINNQCFKCTGHIQIAIT